MKVTIQFTNPHVVVLQNVFVLCFGVVVGAHWGHTLSTGWMLLIATTCLLLSNAALALLLASWAIKTASTSNEHDVVRGPAEPSVHGDDEARAMPATASILYGGTGAIPTSPEEWLDCCIEVLEFSVRTHFALKEANIQLVSDLVLCSVGNLIDAGLSHEGILEIREALERVGLDLRPGADHSREKEDK